MIPAEHIGPLRDVIARALSESRWTITYPDHTEERRARYARERAACEAALEALTPPAPPVLTDDQGEPIPQPELPFQEAT